MKKIWIITGCLAMIAVLAGCDKTRRSPGRAYMPDMSESRAYDAYSSTENLKEHGIYYNARPVEGTIARGDMAAYENKNDSIGYIRSSSVKSPVVDSTVDMKEAERLYMVNCGICHGSKLDGNGPLWNGGDGPYPAAPKNFLADDMKAMSEGTMFHSVTYGKGQMGSYASQLNTLQRWEVIAYIKMKQGGTATTTTTTAVADTTAAATK